MEARKHEIMKWKRVRCKVREQGRQDGEGVGAGSWRWLQLHAHVLRQEFRPSSNHCAAVSQAELEHDSAVTCLCESSASDVNSSSNTVLVGTKDGGVCVWDVTSQYLVNNFQVHDGAVNCLQLSEGI